MNEIGEPRERRREHFGVGDENMLRVESGKMF
jgi:hypothetical protein